MSYMDRLGFTLGPIFNATRQRDVTRLNAHTALWRITNAIALSTHYQCDRSVQENRCMIVVKVIE